MPTTGIGLLPTGVVLRFRHRPNGINLSPHGQRRSITAAEGEVDSSTGAVGWRCHGVPTGGCPEPPHISDHLIEGVPRAHFNTAFTAEFGNAVIHHEGLHGNRPPSIKNAQAQTGIVLNQLLLGVKQALNHPQAQFEGSPRCPIGRPKRHVRMRLNPQQSWRQRLQRLAALFDGNRAPGTHRGGNRWDQFKGVPPLRRRCCASRVSRSNGFCSSSGSVFNSSWAAVRASSRTAPSSARLARARSGRPD